MLFNHSLLFSGKSMQDCISRVGWLPGPPQDRGDAGEQRAEGARELPGRDASFPC